MTRLLRNDPNFEGSLNDLRYPIFTNEHYVTDCAILLAKAAATDDNYRSDVHELFANRIHQLMGRGYTYCVDDWQA